MPLLRCLYWEHCTNNHREMNGNHFCKTPFVPTPEQRETFEVYGLAADMQLWPLFSDVLVSGQPWAIGITTDLRLVVIPDVSASSDNYRYFALLWRTSERAKQSSKRPSLRAEERISAIGSAFENNFPGVIPTATYPRSNPSNEGVLTIPALPYKQDHHSRIKSTTMTVDREGIWKMCLTTDDYAYYTTAERSWREQLGAKGPTGPKGPDGAVMDTTLATLAQATIEVEIGSDGHRVTQTANGTYLEFGNDVYEVLNHETTVSGGDVAEHSFDCCLSGAADRRFVIMISVHVPTGNTVAVDRSREMIYAPAPAKGGELPKKKKGLRGIFNI